MQKNNLQGVSLFSSSGIAETFLKDVGINITVSNELLHDRAALYSSIYSDCKMVTGDITNNAVFQNIIDESGKVDLQGYLIDEEAEKYAKKYAKKSSKKIKKLDDGIEIQAFIFKLTNDKRLKLFEYYKKDSDTSPMRLDILKKYCSGQLSIPSEKQSKILYELYNKSLDEGFVL